MTKIRVTVDAEQLPETLFAATGTFIDAAEDFVRRINNDVPTGVSLDSVTIGDDLTERFTVGDINTVIIAGDDAGPVACPGITTADNLISVLEISTGLEETVVGAVAGDVTLVNGLTTTDTLIGVYKVSEANPPTCDDLTDEFTITGLNTINNTGGTSSLGELLIVVGQRKADLTDEFTISADDEIDNTGGSSTAGVENRLVVTWANIEST